MARLFLFLRGPALGLLAFAGSLVGFHLSEFVPALPVADAMGAIGAALLDQAPPTSDIETIVAMQSAYWYRHAALPAITGILLGVVVSPWLRLSVLDTLAATATYVLVHVLFFRVAGVETWIGFASFMCTLAGANTVVRDLARATMSKWSPTGPVG